MEEHFKLDSYWLRRISFLLVFWINILTLFHLQLSIILISSCFRFHFFSQFITTRKRSLQRSCFYTCLSVILFTGGEHAWCGACVAGGHACQGVCMVGGHTWCGGTWQVGGVHGTHNPPRYYQIRWYGQSAGGTHPTGMHSGSCSGLTNLYICNEVISFSY